MTAIRHHRVAEQMKKEVADIIRTDVKDQRIGFATVTRVELSNDLQHAKVHVSVFGSAEEKQATLAALQRAAGFIRGEVSRRLRMRVTPEMVFLLDESGEYSAHIESVLRDLKKSAPARAAEETEE
ncbi:MAG: 30S ribosome-binding factor RbfA [Alicyclobacillus sp.]|nr:30S ribosome-binding factor RbfA [Alicyclobacillus sp.]